MSTPRLYNTEAVVLRKTELGEADSILTLYTPHLGKTRVVAKGVRRPKSKMGGRVEQLVHGQMLLAQTKSLASCNRKGYNSNQNDYTTWIL